MNPDFKLYAIFDAVVRTGSISAAARELYLSQPAVSQAVAQLEAQLGGDVVTRTPRGVHLTAEGAALHPYVQQALATLRNGQERFWDRQALREGTLRIGGSDTLCQHFMLPTLETYHARYENIGIQVTNRTSRGTLELLRSGQVDVGFINMPLPVDGLDAVPLLTVRDCLVAGARFDRLRGAALKVEELPRLPLMMLETEALTRQVVDDFCSRHGAVLKPQVELCSLDLLVEFARIGLGVACVIREFVPLALFDQGTLFEVELQDPFPPRQIAMVTMGSMPLSVAAQRFRDLILEDHGLAETQPREAD